MTVLVIGARSKIGSALLDELTARGEKVRALTRAGESNGPDAIEQVRGDLADPASLPAAMGGVDAVFLLSTPAAEDVTWHRNAIDAARRAGIGRLVRSSLLGADPRSDCTFRRHHGETDAYLAGSGVPYTVLRPNYYMQNVPDNIVASIQPDGGFRGSAGTARLSMVDTRDVAAVAARVLTEDGHLGKVYPLVGPQALSHPEVADVLTARFGWPVRYVEVPLEETRATMAGFGLDPWLVNAVVELYADYQRSGPVGYAAQRGDDLATLLGRAPRTLEDLLAERFPAGSPHPSPRKQVVLRVYRDLFTEGRLDLADELLADGYVNHGAPEGVSPDRAGVKQIVRNLHEAYPGFVSQVDLMVEEGDMVAVRGQFTGGELVDFFRFDREGRIAERWA
jgi:uncharacterized protein YbjT (DUF2867 family)/predicted SnoaL-like aldol condensation-catalyzing enzyme